MLFFELLSSFLFLLIVTIFQPLYPPYPDKHGTPEEGQRIQRLKLVTTIKKRTKVWDITHKILYIKIFIYFFFEGGIIFLRSRLIPFLFLILLFFLSLNWNNNLSYFSLDQQWKYFHNFFLSLVFIETWNHFHNFFLFFSLHWNNFHDFFHFLVRHRKLKPFS